MLKFDENIPRLKNIDTVFNYLHEIKWGVE